MNPEPGSESVRRPRRKSIRLKIYDYSQVSGYFVTIVTQERKPFFGKICNGEMTLSEAGQMVMHEWEALPERFPNITIDVFQVMPNHFHTVLLLHDPKFVGAGLVPARETRATSRVAPTHMEIVDDAKVTTRVAPALGEIIGAYKSITMHKFIQGVKERAWPAFAGKLWQRNYYEHILRSQEDYERIGGYIRDNPANWEQDNENPLNLHPIYKKSIPYTGDKPP
jgi:putative transposase